VDNFLPLAAGFLFPILEFLSTIGFLEKMRINLYITSIYFINNWQTAPWFIFFSLNNSPN
jgi:hypothetical protein